MCHGLNAVSGGQVPDLRYLPVPLHEQFAQIVKGAFRTLGMPAFGNQLSDQQIELIHQYVIKRSHDLVERRSKPSGESPP
ncbi:MAG: cytochrome c [Salinisphaera sp.]|nr:cytochrome c [Salinisphaera sp.]